MNFNWLTKIMNLEHPAHQVSDCHVLIVAQFERSLAICCAFFGADANVEKQGHRIRQTVSNGEMKCIPSVQETRMIAQTLSFRFPAVSRRLNQGQLRVPGKAARKPDPA